MTTEDVIEGNAKQLEMVTREAKKSDSETRMAVGDLMSPDYVHHVNKGNTGHSNPVVGSPQDAKTLHILIVEDNLINQKVFASSYVCCIHRH